MLKLKLFHKFFIAFFLTALVAIGCMMGAMSFFLTYKFSEAIADDALDRHQAVADELIRSYQSANGWKWLEGNYEEWEALINLRRDLKGKKTYRPPSHKAESAQWAMKKNQSTLHIPTHTNKIKIHRFIVFDGNLAHIIGGTSHDPKAYVLRPLRVSGQIIGWFGRYKPPPQFIQNVERILVRRLNWLYGVAGMTFVMAVTATFFLTRHLLAPIQEIKQGAKALTARKLDTSIKVCSNDELGQLAEDFNKMARTLKAYEALRRKWVADISHDLRTPLLTLSGQIEILKDGIEEVSPQALESLYADACHLGAIVNDLHDLSILDSESLAVQQMDPVNIVKILKELILHFTPPLLDRGIKIQDLIQDDFQVKIKGNETRFRQLFLNLFQNSLKYVKGPGILRIGHVCRDNRLTIFFEDSGPGVPEEDLPHLFERLYRVDKSRNRKCGGSGLGLSICKSIVTAFGGTIRAVNGNLGGLRIEMEFYRVG